MEHTSKYQSEIGPEVIPTRPFTLLRDRENNYWSIIVEPSGCNFVHKPMCCIFQKSIKLPQKSTEHWLLIKKSQLTWSNENPIYKPPTSPVFSFKFSPKKSSSQSLACWIFGPAGIHVPSAHSHGQKTRATRRFWSRPQRVGRPKMMDLQISFRDCYGNTPKWMVKIMVPNPMNKWMIWGCFPIFGETPISLGIGKWEWYGNSMGPAYHFRGSHVLGGPSKSHWLTIDWIMSAKA